MESGYYAAFTALLAGTQALELAAHNLANISTTGYKAQREFYNSLNASLSSPARQVSVLNRAINDYAVLGGARVDIQQGMLEQSNVDVVDQFVQMILTQRAYEANSRVVEAANQMFENLNNVNR